MIAGPVHGGLWFSKDPEGVEDPCSRGKEEGASTRQGLREGCLPDAHFRAHAGCRSQAAEQQLRQELAAQQQREAVLQVGRQWKGHTKTEAGPWRQLRLSGGSREFPAQSLTSGPSSLRPITADPAALAHLLPCPLLARAL